MECFQKVVLHEVPMLEKVRQSINDSLWKRIERLLEEIRARAVPQTLIGRWWRVSFISFGSGVLGGICPTSLGLDA